MRFLISIVFVGMLALSSQAFAYKFVGEAAETILLEGKIVADNWDEWNGHHTRVIFDDTIWACYSTSEQQGENRIQISCVNAHDLPKRR